MRITLENFRDHVTPFELKKGRDYFDKGRVTDLQRSATGRWTAIVKGREPYKVRFDTRGGEIGEVFCDCIAQAENMYCKHVLAMLLAIEKEGAKVVPFMDYEEETRLMEYTIRAEMRKQEFQPAANRILALIKSMPSLSEQDEDEDLDQRIYDRVKIGFKLMVELARSAASQELKDRMYKRSLEVSLDRRWTPWHCDPHWMEVLVILSKGKEAEVLAIVNKLLELESDFNKGFDHYLIRFLAKKVELLQAMGQTEQAIRLVETYPLSKLLREKLIRESEMTGNYFMVKSLLEHGLQTAMQVEPHLHSHWQVTLLKMAQKFGDQVTVREYGARLYDETGDMEYFRLVKQAYESKDWPRRLEADFVKPLEKEAHGPNEYPDRLAAIYAEEQDWPRLLKLLQRKPFFSLVQVYTELLLPHFPAELLQLYRTGLIEYATENKNADAITEVCTIMHRMKTWPGGRKAVKELGDEFQSVFPSRKKLLEAVEGFR